MASPSLTSRPSDRPLPIKTLRSLTSSPVPLQPALSSASHTECFLKLSDRFVHFDPVTKGTAVFYDDIQSQIFVVRDNGSGGVKVHSSYPSRNSEFFFEDKGPVLSIKFSPDLRILSVQRSNKSVEFLNVIDSFSVDLTEYSQMCRARSAKILGFCWVSVNEIVLITDTQGLESYGIRTDKKILKSLKNYSFAVNWFLYTPPYLLLSSGINCNVLHIFVLKPGGNYQRYPKFEVDVGWSHPVQNQPAKLLERDVVLAAVYGNLYVLIVKQVSKLNAGAEVVVYHVFREGTVRITDVLLLECNGRFAINILDNLIVVHHQQSKMSKIFDLKLNTRGDAVKYHYPISSYSIEPYQVKLNGLSLPYELYSSNWAVFLPSVIVDAKLGCLWQLEVKSDHLASLIYDKVKRLEFLLLRDSEVKPVLLKHLLQFLQDPADYHVVVRAFDLLNTKLTAVLMKTHHDDGRRTVYLDQVEVFRFLLLPLAVSQDLDRRYIVAVMTEYLKSLIIYNLEPQYFLYELLVDTLVKFGMLYLLHHFVDNHVFVDSKPFACLLLSLESVFPPAFQMALDMLKRIGSSMEEQVEILLAKNKIFAALRLIQSPGNQTEAQLAPRKFLEPALQSGDEVLFYSVYRYFQQRNIRLRNSPNFLSEELCDDIVFQFDFLFPDHHDSQEFVF